MSVKGSELETASEVKISVKHTGSKIDLIAEILEERRDAIRTDNDVYWDYLKEIEDSAFDANN